MIAWIFKHKKSKHSTRLRRRGVYWQHCCIPYRVGTLHKDSKPRLANDKSYFVFAFAP